MLIPGLYRHPLGDIWMPSCFPPEALDAALTFQLRDTDILTSTYPKTGEMLLLVAAYAGR